MADQEQVIERTWIMGTDENGQVQPPFDFDCVLSEDHTSELAITDEPVETGVMFTDHAYLLPRVLEVRAIVSDVYLDMREANGTKVGPVKRDKDWLVPTDGSDSAGRAARAYQLLLGLQASRIPFGVQTGLLWYPQVLLKKISALQDKRTAGALIFTATLREVQFVSTETVKYPPRGDKKTSIKAAKQTTSGEKQAVAPATEQKRVGVLLQGLRATGAVGGG